MQKACFFGMVSAKQLPVQDSIFPVCSNALSQQVHYHNSNNPTTSVFYDIHIRYTNNDRVSVVDNDRLCIICIGYSFQHLNLASIVAKIYLADGIHAVRTIPGYYNFILIDKEKNHIQIGTDFAGTCPVYYSQNKNTIMFSNTIKNIILNRAENPCFNFGVLTELFYLGMVTPPDTLVKDIYSIPTEQYLHYDNKAELKTFIQQLPEYGVFDENDLYNSLMQTLSPLASYDNIGVMCSGGLDSSLLTALLREQTDSKINLFTLFYDKNHSDVTNSRLLAKLCNANNCYYQQESQGFMAAIFESLWLMESEAVGTLSFNLALELFFSKFIATSVNDVILTGDTHFLKTESSSSIEAYIKKYGLCASAGIMPVLRLNNNFGYFSFLKKYKFDLNSKQWFFPEVLALRLTGKLRMKMAVSQKYHLPFIDRNYLNYLEHLRREKTDFNYRLILARLAKNRNILPKEILLTKKSWLPSWVENNKVDDMISFMIKQVTRVDSFCFSIFGANITQIMVDEYHQYKNNRLILALFYLELFYQHFINNTKNLASKEAFIGESSVLFQ